MYIYVHSRKPRNNVDKILDSKTETFYRYYFRGVFLYSFYESSLSHCIPRMNFLPEEKFISPPCLFHHPLQRTTEKWIPRQTRGEPLNILSPDKIVAITWARSNIYSLIAGILSAWKSSFDKREYKRIRMSKHKCVCENTARYNHTDLSPISIVN